MHPFTALALFAGMATQAQPEMQTSPATTLRHERLSVDVGAPFIIADRDRNPDEVICVYPDLVQANGRLFLNWHFDFDVLDRDIPTRPNGRVSEDGGLTWKRQTALMPQGCKFATGPREITA